MRWKVRRTGIPRAKDKEKWKKKKKAWPKRKRHQHSTCHVTSLPFYHIFYSLVHPWSERKEKVKVKKKKVKSLPRWQLLGHSRDNKLEAFALSHTWKEQVNCYNWIWEGKNERVLSEIRWRMRKISLLHIRQSKEKRIKWMQGNSSSTGSSVLLDDGHQGDRRANISIGLEHLYSKLLGGQSWTVLAYLLF